MNQSLGEGFLAFCEAAFFAQPACMFFARGPWTRLIIASRVGGKFHDLQMLIVSWYWLILFIFMAILWAPSIAYLLANSLIFACKSSTPAYVASISLSFRASGYWTVIAQTNLVQIAGSSLAAHTFM